ncbi:XRE family transcriptional regulator [Bradyrhizobium lupini]|uniref:XRE family transcriptional regulator n=1 Tax=Rhizobium lupini TaxID=136996 RepID=UPI0034C6772A
MEQRLTLGKRIAAARRRSDGKLTQAQVAEELRVTPQAVSGWERDESRPDIGKLDALARLLGTSVDYLMGGDPDLIKSVHTELDQQWAEQGRRLAQTPEYQRVFLAEKLTKGPLGGAADFPIYIAASDTEGSMTIEASPIQFVRRPPLLERVSGSYGVLISGNDMEPAYRERDLVLVHPLASMSSDADVLLLKRPPSSGDAQALLRRLALQDERTFTVRRFNPPESVTVARSDWPICHGIVGRLSSLYFLN